MRIVLLSAVLSLLVAAGAAGAEATGGRDGGPDSPPENPYPDLLGEDPGGDPFIPDLLQDDPFVPDPPRFLGDPIFEDDFTLSEPPTLIYDPLEPFNRAVFVFNDRVYFWVLKPTKNFYAGLLPADIRRCLGNAFDNIAAPIRFVNDILQGEFEDAGIVLSRFVINSTLGVFGLGDPAFRDFGLEPRRADLGQTLGKWGMGDGMYLVLPLFGPSNLRDTAGFAGDVFLHPVPYLSDSTAFDLGYLAVNRVNLLSISPDVYEELKRISLDPYVAARQGYYDFRQSIIQENPR